MLVEQIKNYIRESFSYDYRKLIDGYDFLEKLKPSIRSELVKQLYPRFFREF